MSDEINVNNPIPSENEGETPQIDTGPDVDTGETSYQEYGGEHVSFSQNDKTV